MPIVWMDIRDEAIEFESHREERTETVRRWGEQLDRMRRSTRDLQIEDSGETIRLGELSPGCRVCKEGKWECLFLSMTCNLSCGFCLTPRNCKNPAVLSAMGNDLDAVDEYFANSDILGVGFSGGEPLLELPRLLNSISRLRGRRPNLYLWTYTNGLLLTREILSSLAAAGLDELRFNLAATGYRHEYVASMIQYSCGCLPSVTVEIPAIPEDGELLREALPSWSRMGVKHLNLHELIYEPGSPSEMMGGARERCRMPDGHVCEYNPFSSELASEVMNDIDSGNLRIAVNYCSMASKARQLRGRRRRMASYTLQTHERLLDDGEAESVCYFKGVHCEFAHPSTLTDFRVKDKGWGIALVRRLLPLTRRGPGQWTHFEVIREGPES